MLPFVAWLIPDFEGVCLFDSFQHLGHQSVAQPDFQITPFVDVLPHQHIHERLVPVVLNEAFTDRQHLLALVQHHIGGGGISGTKELSLIENHRGFDFKLDGTSFRHTLGCDVLEGGWDLASFNGANGQTNGHALVKLLHLALVDFAHELQIRHVRHRGDGGSLVEVVGLNDAVAFLDGHLEHHPGHRGFHEGVGCIAAPAGCDAFLHNAKVVLGRVELLAGLLEGKLCALRLGGSEHTAGQQVGVSVVVQLRVVQGDLRPGQTRLRVAQRRHVRHDHDLGKHVACLHGIPRFHEHPSHNAGHLWLDEDLLTWLDAARGERLQDDVRHPRRFRAVGCFGLLFLVAQMLDRVHRARQHEQNANQEGNKFSVFHDLRF